MTRTVAFLLLVSLHPGAAQNPPDVKTRARELQNSQVKVTMQDQSIAEGRIVRVEADSFTLQPKKTAPEIAVRFDQVREIRKAGMSRRTKSILIPAAIGGGALLFLCVAPYPIGFLCRKDPS